MTDSQRVTAASGGRSDAFVLDWDTMRWTSSGQYDMAEFPFIAEVRGKRYELYGDGTFDEEELPADSEVDEPSA